MMGYLQVLTILWSRTSSFGKHRAVAERPCHLEAGGSWGGEQGKVWWQASLPLQGVAMVLFCYGLKCKQSDMYTCKSVWWSLIWSTQVLSVGKALSIQAHPDLPHAQQLHKERPEVITATLFVSNNLLCRESLQVYKDPNHKPEIAIALTDFEGLCGFRPLQEIQGFIARLVRMFFPYLA